MCCLYLCVSVSLCVYKCMYVSLCMCICVYVSICLGVYVCVSACLRVYVCASVCLVTPRDPEDSLAEVVSWVQSIWTQSGISLLMQQRRHCPPSTEPVPHTLTATHSKAVLQTTCYTHTHTVTHSEAVLKTTCGHTGRPDTEQLVIYIC